MTIASLADYRSSYRQTVMKAEVNATGINDVGVYLNWLAAGAGATGTPYNPTNTTTGVVPVAGTSGTGSPTIAPFSGNGYITQVDPQMAWAGAFIQVYDILFACGGFASGSFSLSSQPSFSSRVPGGNYSGLRIFCYKVGTNPNGAGPFTATITYTNQSGATGHVTPSFTPLSGSVEILPIPLASGDDGLQKIEVVNIAGTDTNAIWVFVVARFLCGGPTLSARASGSSDGPGDMRSGQERRIWLSETAMPEIFSNSCIAALGHQFDGSGRVLDTDPTLDLSLEVAAL